MNDIYINEVVNHYSVKIIYSEYAPVPIINTASRVSGTTIINCQLTQG